MPSSQFRVTTLPNGLRVASIDTLDQVSAMTVLLNMGSRDEKSSKVSGGHTAALERMAFQATKNFSAERMRDLCLAMGGKFICMGSRDDLSFSGEALRGEATQMLDVLTDAALVPTVDDAVVSAALSHLRQDIESLPDDPERWMKEAFVDCAFSGSSLGNPYLRLDADTVEASLSPESIRSFLQLNLSPSRMVISAVNVDHDELVYLAHQMVSAKAPSSSSLSVVDATASRDPSKYSGGEIRFHKIDKPMKVHMHIPPLTYVSIGFKGPVAFSDRDFIVLSVLRSMLGGGSSFSAGGPGKGMYSRLYRNVLCRFHFVQSASAFMSTGADFSLFGVDGSAPHEFALPLTEILVTQLRELAESLPDEVEFLRAKNQLKSQVLMALESRSHLAEDAGRQILSYGQTVPNKEICAWIDSVTRQEARDGVARLLAAPQPTLAVFGNTAAVPRVDEIARVLRS